MIRRRLVWLALLGAVGCSDSPPTGPGALPQDPPPPPPELHPERAPELGGAVFQDINLSLNRNQACITCHDPAWGFSGPDPSINGQGSVFPGSVTERFGTRRPPSAAYAGFATPLAWDPDAEVFRGGAFVDGRATGERLGDPAAEQARAPFLDPNEQALPDPACVVLRVRSASYAGVYRDVYGVGIDSIAFPADANDLCSQEGTTLSLSTADRARVERAFDNVGLAVAAFERSPAVSPFTSKFDAYLAGQAELNGAEALGLELFDGKANCSRCHLIDGERPLFTDFSFHNVGTPPNRQNPARVADPTFVDEGLGAFLRERGEPEAVWRPQVGAMKTPTLRNIERKTQPNAIKPYLHNGALVSLEHVVAFYSTRDVLGDCEVVRPAHFSRTCWPLPEVAENMNTEHMGDLQLTREEQTALVAFLRTLNDGWSGG